MDESLQLTNETTTESLLELGSVLDVSLNDWNEELSARSNKTRAEKNGGSLSTNAVPIPGTKDPTKSLKCDAKLKKNGEKAPSIGSDASKKAVVTETVTKPSHASRRAARRKSDLLAAAYSNLLLRAKARPPTWLPSSKRFFSGLAVEMNKGFSSLSALLKAKNDAKSVDNAPAISDSDTDDHDSDSDKESEELARKKQKTDDGVVLSKDNSDILNKLEKEFNVSEQDGTEIHGNLATIVQKLLKYKPEEDKLTEIKKRYLRPQNCETLAETRISFLNCLTKDLLTVLSTVPEVHCLLMCPWMMDL